MKSNQKKTAIIKTAIRCVAQYGTEGASADVIARKMGIAQSGIFYYFPKQEALFDSLLGYIAQVNHEIAMKYFGEMKLNTMRERLTGHVTANLIWANKHPDHISVLLLSMAKTGRSRLMRERVNHLFQVGEDRIYSILQEGVAQGEFHSSGDLRDLAVFIHKALGGSILSFYYSRHLRSVEYYQNILSGQIAQLLKNP